MANGESRTSKRRCILSSNSNSGTSGSSCAEPTAAHSTIPVVVAKLTETLVPPWSRVFPEYTTQWVGPVEFIASTPKHACDYIIALAQAGKTRHIHLSNAYTIALADQDSNYRDILANPALNFPDGKPIGWVSAISRHSPRLRQVRGPQLFLDVLDQGRDHGIRHFLLGSTHEVLKEMEARLKARFPGIRIVGVNSPPFRRLTSSEILHQDATILASGAQIVWVGLGTPKQDLEAQRIADRLPIVAIAIGAAFDFAAGTLAIAPSWMRVAGLEWVHRFASEPRRLWRRYIFGNARFIKAVLFPAKRRRRDQKKFPKR